MRNSTGWITVGYALKSRSNEKLQTRAVLLQKMVKNLRVKDLCEKVYVSPVCAADSPLLKRDSVPTASAMIIMDKLRHKDGDLQGTGALCYSTVLITFVFFHFRSDNVCNNYKLPRYFFPQVGIALA